MGEMLSCLYELDSDQVVRAINWALNAGMLVDSLELSGDTWTVCVLIRADSTELVFDLIDQFKSAVYDEKS